MIYINITKTQAKKRLEEIRKSIKAENISYGELFELQTLIKYIDSGDVELLEAAGVPEFEDEEYIDNIIPTILAEMQSDTDNESSHLLDYWNDCNVEKREAINNVMIYLTGWTFPTIIEKSKSI